jgi:hypothetical protein
MVPSGKANHEMEGLLWEEHLEQKWEIKQVHWID